jgi:hypothetical protein
MTSGSFEGNNPPTSNSTKSAKWIALVIVLAIFVGITIFFINCTGSCVNTIANSPDTKDLIILNYHATTSEYGSYIIVGTAQNTGSKEMEYAEVDVKFYDSYGNLIDSSLDNINNLGAGETWNFEVYFLGSGTVGTYTINPGSVW